MLQLLEWFIAGYGHLVDWDLFERLGAAAERLTGVAYTNESVKLICDYRDDAAAVYPAAGSAFDRALDDGLQHRISPPGLDHQDIDRRTCGTSQELHQ